MGSLETGVSFKKDQQNHHPQKLRSLSSSRPRSRLKRFLLPKRLGYLQWICTVLVFCLFLVLFQFFLPGLKVDRHGIPIPEGELVSGDSFYLKNIIGPLDFGEDLKFEPRRVLARFQKEILEINTSYVSKAVTRFGHRKPRLALVFADLEVDPYQILMATVIPALQELGYAIEVFSNQDGPSHVVWQSMGVPVTFIQNNAKDKIAVDWLNYDGILVNSLEAKGVIACLAQEPFKSLSVIWTVHEKTLATQIAHYTSVGKTGVLHDWHRSFSRATVVVFQDVALPMIYSRFDTGNYFVIPAPTEECESGHLLTQSEGYLRANISLTDDDFVIAIVGSQFFYKGLWLDHSLVLRALMPLLSGFPSVIDSESRLKILILTGDSTHNYTSVVEAISAGLRYPKDTVRHVAGDANSDYALKVSNLVIYGSFLEEQAFPEVLIKALCFGKLTVAPNLSVIEKFVNDRVNGYIFPKEDIKALTNIISQVISNGELSPLAQNVALTGKETAKNLMASESIEGYASLIEAVLKLPSEVAAPKPVTEISSHNKMEWNRNIFSLVPDAAFKNRKSRASTFLEVMEQAGKNHMGSGSSIDAIDELSLNKIWEQEKEIQTALGRKRRSEEELKDRSDQSRASWEDVYRNAKRADRLKNDLHERDDGELERTGQPLTIYEPFFGEGTWPFLHVTSLYRGISLSTKGRRPGGDDIDAPSRLPVLSNPYYRDLLGEIGTFFAISNRIDRIHKNAWIGFQSWRATAKNASLSKTAETALLKSIQTRGNGDTLYFWVRMDRDPRHPMSLDFWSFCDSINAGNCRSAFSDAFKRMYAVKIESDSLPPMPLSEGTWSVMHSWTLPTKSFMEYVMFARMFVDAMDVQMHDEHNQTGYCPLSLSKDKHCYSRVLELLVNVWAYHSARKMVWVNPETGLMEEQHPLKNRKGKMWVKWFSYHTLKSMDEDLAEETDTDPPKRKWLWPLTGEVFWQGMYEKERTMRLQDKAKRKQQSREKLQRMRRRMKQKVIGKYVKPLPEEETKKNTTSDLGVGLEHRRR